MKVVSDFQLFIKYSHFNKRTWRETGEISELIKHQENNIYYICSSCLNNTSDYCRKYIIIGIDTINQVSAERHLRLRLFIDCQTEALLGPVEAEGRRTVIF